MNAKHVATASKLLRISTTVGTGLDLLRTHFTLPRKVGLVSRLVTGGLGVRVTTTVATKGMATILCTAGEGQVRMRVHGGLVKADHAAAMRLGAPTPKRIVFELTLVDKTEVLRPVGSPNQLPHEPRLDGDLAVFHRTTQPILDSLAFIDGGSNIEAQAVLAEVVTTITPHLR
jgi:hypothetical protein